MMLALVGVVAAHAADWIPADQAKDHVGETATVRGLVAQVSSKNGNLLPELRARRVGQVRRADGFRHREDHALPRDAGDSRDDSFAVRAEIIISAFQPLHSSKYEPVIVNF